jgi:hypothetical protein
MIQLNLALLDRSSSTVAYYAPHHSMVESLSPASATTTGRGKGVKEVWQRSFVVTA